ncbi:MAG TPA: DNA repair protein RadA [Ktedonobacterales bacterium]|jgi:DNA repair protein RadA/Sms
MPKTYTKYTCQQCGYESAKYLGRCPDCSAWNSMVETVEQAASAARASGGSQRASGGLSGIYNQPIPLPEVRAIAHTRLSTGIGEMNRVLGGGLVPGSVVLIGGEPGIGKSTLLLQVAGNIAETTGVVLYVTAEESAEQVKIRAERLGISSSRLSLYPESDLDTIAEAINGLKPALVIVDSIQTIASEQLTSAPGSISQVRDGANRLHRIAKSLHIPIFIIGHVTKEGSVAGPRALEHIVDAVLYLEGERFHTYRLLRGAKNRFGATHEVGVFEMQGEGMVEIPNPSAVFLNERGPRSTGTSVVVSMEGTRPLLVEVQALTSTTAFGTPRITTTGVDHNRLLMLLAVLTKRVGLLLYNHDVYVNVVGGFSLDEPGVDLGVAAAVASSFKERQVPPDVALIGEVGLSGEVRSVSRVALRVREAAKLGFRRCIVPKSGTPLDILDNWTPSTSGQALDHDGDGPRERGAQPHAKAKTSPGSPAEGRQGIELVRVATLAQALEAALD